MDGRPIERFLAEELLAPLGMADTRLGIPAAEQAALQGRLARVALGRTEREPYADQAMVERLNGTEEIAQPNPSGGMRGPARDLGRFYDWMLGGGEGQTPSLVERRTMALFTACHRWNLPDLTLMQAPLPWGLGFGLWGNADFHRAASRRVFGHSGLVSSVALGDPERGVSCAVITTGLLDPIGNARRLREVNGAVLEACHP